MTAAQLILNAAEHRALGRFCAGVLCLVSHFLNRAHNMSLVPLFQPVTALH